MEMEMATKNAITKEFAPKYRKAKGKTEKTKILNAYLLATGLKSRKNAITRLNGFGLKRLMKVDGKWVNVVAGGKRKKRKYGRYYDGEVDKALIKLWAYFLFVCAERLQPMLAANLDSPSLRKKIKMSDEVCEKLKKISVSTVKRRIKKEKEKTNRKGKTTTKRGELLKNQIPVRVFWAWDDMKPGFCEMDTVSHDGGGEINSHYAWSLDVTDVCLCWTEVRALKNKAQAWMDEAINDIYSSFPVPIRGVDSDGGPEFINLRMKKWCEERGITFTRGRAYHSNDNAFVEQKNGDHIRKMLGYSRFEGDEVFEALAEVYKYLNPLLNYFYYTKKLISKEVQPNGKPKKNYEKVLKTPYMRVLEHPGVSDACKAGVRAVMKGLDIVGLHDKFYKARERLDKAVLKYYASLEANASQGSTVGSNLS
jgi:transposase InsO family protein